MDGHEISGKDRWFDEREKPKKNISVAWKVVIISIKLLKYLNDEEVV